MLTTSADAATGDRSVDVAHEALIRGWPRLRQWIDEDRAGLRIHRRLSESAHEWERRGRDDSFLYRGSRLGEAQEWQTQNDADLNQAEREFLRASEEQEARERRAARKRRMMAGVQVAAVVIAIPIAGLTVLALQQRSEAVRA